MQVINEIPIWYALRNPKPKMHFEIPNWNALRNPKPKMHFEIPNWNALRNSKPKMHFEIPNWNALRNPKPRMHYEILNREAKRNSNRKYNTKGEVLEVTEPLSNTPKWQIAFRYLSHWTDKLHFDTWIQFTIVKSNQNSILKSKWQNVNCHNVWTPKWNAIIPNPSCN